MIKGGTQLLLFLILLLHFSHSILEESLFCDSDEEKGDISWCYNTNPFRLPENLNYSLEPHPVISEFRCHGHPFNPTDSCSLAESVEFIEVNNISTIFITTQEGGYVELEVSTELVHSIGYFGNETLSLTSSWNYDEKLAFKLLTSNGSHHFYISANLTEKIYLFEGNYSENFAIVEAHMWTNTSGEVYVAVLLSDEQTKTHVLDFSVLHVSKFQDESYQITFSQSVHSWKILVQNQTWWKISGFQIEVQRGQYDEYKVPQSSRTLIALYNQLGICIYQFVPSLRGEVLVPFGPYVNTENTWMFYVGSDFFTTEEKPIVVAGMSMITENRTRGSGSTINPAALVHLVVAEKSPSLATRTITLTDFATYPFWQPANNSVEKHTRHQSQFLEAIINPAGKRFPCNSTLLQGPLCTPVQATKNILYSKDPCHVTIQSRNIGNPPHGITFIAADKWIWVIGTVPDNNASHSHNSTLSQIFNAFEAVGNVKKVAVSPNGMHVILLVQRFKFEMDSLTRYHQICSILQDPKGNTTQQAYLKSYKPACENYPSSRFPDINDYVQHVSVCPSNLYCHSLLQNKHSHVLPGYYVENSFLQQMCEPGYYCMDGVKRECPVGFLCPEPGMPQPASCAVVFNGMGGNEETCASTKLTKVSYCPPGTVCPTKSFLPIPAPPGYKANYTIPDWDNWNTTMDSNIIVLEKCHLGEWCSLGRSVLENDTTCPEASVCVGPSVLTPTPCTCSEKSCDYCPNGTYIEDKCPAGFYCKGPTNKTPCHLTQYCPPGSIQPILCPAGHYCPKPTEKLQCPSGHFCHVGSVSPTRCPLFSICPPGTSKTQYNYGEVIVAFVFITLGVLGRCIFLKMRNKRRKLIEDLRSQEEGELSPRNKGPPCLSPARFSRASFYRIKDPQKRKQKALEIFGQVLERDIRGLTFDFIDLGLKLNSGKQILQGVTGTIKSGRVTAVMGPSGAGKTTFLTTIASKVPAGTVTGKVLINGQPSDLSKYKHLVGYVPQEDIMLRMLTVKELLAFNASLRLPATVCWEDRHDIVNAVIEILGLYDVRHSIIGDETRRGISGGQRKRVNIGMELVSAPLVLFLDEPTSGLDSTSSQEICEALRTIASFGLTVVTVIHQPRYEIFEMFDDVLLLGKGGRTVFLGPTSQTLDYFESLGFHCPQHTNPADFFMDVLSGTVKRDGHPNFTPSDLFDEWTNYSRSKRASLSFELSPKDDNNDSIIEPFQITSEDDDFDEENNSESELWIKKKPITLAPNRVPFYTEFLHFLLRTLVQQSRDLSSLLIDMALVCTAGTFLGLIFSDSSEYVGPPDPAVCQDIMVPTLRKKCMFPISDPTPSMALMSCLSLALTATSSSLRVFGTERVVYWRESSSGLSTLAYFLAKGHIPNLIFFPLVFLTLYYSLVAPRAFFSDLYLLFFSLQFAGMSVGYLVSILVKPQVSQMTGVTIILLMMMFSGTKPSLRQLNEMPFPLPYLPQFSFLRWAMEANYLAEVVRWEEVYNIETGITGIGYERDNFTIDILMIFLLGFTLRAISLILMFALHRSKKK